MNKTTANTQTATFGAGCFWNSQHTFHNIPGVVASEVGFMDDVEVVRVSYDPVQVSYDQLLDTFWGSHDLSVGSGGERSVLFVDGDQQAGMARQQLAAKVGNAAGKISTEVRSMSVFTRAPESEQRYLEKRS